MAEPQPPHPPSRPSPDDDPERLRRMLRRAPAHGEVEDRRRAIARREELDEGPSQEDIERFGDVTQTCPECKREVFDDSDICYHCGHAISKAAGAVHRPPAWILVTVAVVILAFVVLLFRGVL